MWVIELVGRFPERFRVEQLLTDAQEQQVVAAIVMPVRDVRDLIQRRAMDEAVALEVFGEIFPVEQRLPPQVFGFDVIDHAVSSSGQKCSITVVASSPSLYN